VARIRKGDPPGRPYKSFPALIGFFAIALATAAIISCAGAAKKVSDNTLIKLEDVRMDDPARQGLTLARELLGAVVGVPSSSRDEYLSLTIQLYLENKNGFTLSMTSVTYAFLVDGRIAATGQMDGKNGELAFKPGEGRVVELPLRVFTRELIGHVLGGIVKKGAKLSVTGNMTFDTAVGEITFPYNCEKTL
ncbi:MAG: LEA type 2 family protein, partial [Nitrospinae bacterium]|nr:LEA type 2 family protein [Nitrospinota bacterium]